MMAPAMKPPATPAPTAQPKQPPASAGLGAASGAAPIDAAAARESRVFFIAGLLEGRSEQPDRGNIPWKGCAKVARRCPELIPTLTKSDRRPPNRGGRWT